MLKSKVFLTPTDTTIGFVSQDADRLTQIKQRLLHKHYIKAVNSLATLKSFARIPVDHKKRVRRSKKTTYILPNGHSCRVVRDSRHLLLLDRLRWAYTTSANPSGKGYDEKFARDNADVIVMSPVEHDGVASSIFKLGRYALRKIR